MTKDVLRMKQRLEKNPLFWLLPEGSGVICKECVSDPEKSQIVFKTMKLGRKVALYRVTNYNEFHTCGTCKRSARHAPFLA